MIRNVVLGRLRAAPDPEHNRYRAMIAAVCEQIARVQFEIG